RWRRRSAPGSGRARCWAARRGGVGSAAGVAVGPGRAHPARRQVGAGGTGERPARAPRPGARTRRCRAPSRGDRRVDAASWMVRTQRPVSAGTPPATAPPYARSARRRHRQRRDGPAGRCTARPGGPDRMCGMSSPPPDGSAPRRAPGPRGPARAATGPGRQYHVPAPDGSGAPGGAAPQAPPARPPRRTAPPRPPAPPTPPTAPAPERPGGPGRRRGRRWLLVALAVLLLGLLGVLAWGWITWSRIETVDLDDVLDPVTGDEVNYLLVGSDARDELDPEGDSGVTGKRSDTLILLRTSSEGSRMMSIPRDLWVTIADTGVEGRINGAYNRGPANLVATVRSSLDVPVHHYVEIGFASFVGLVDSLGGVTMEV